MTRPPLLKDRVAVDPLDDDRWARIERGVVASARDVIGTRAPVRATRAGWLYAGGLAAAAALVILAVAKLSGPGPAAAPVAIATGAHGTRIDLGDAVVEAGAETSFTITRPGGGVALALTHGRIDLDVPHRSGKAPLVVHAGDVDVIDVGTVFSVTRGDTVTVEVREGEVQVARAGETSRVTAGHRWSEPMIARIDPAAPQTTSPAPASSGGATIASSGATIASAGAAIPAAGPAIPIGGPDDLLGRRHVATAPIAHAAEHHGSGNGNGNGNGSGNGSGNGNGSGAGSSAIVDLHAAILAEQVAPAVNVATKDPAGAFASYQDMMLHAAGGTASQGLYGMARTKFAAGLPEAAMQWLDAYRTRFPQGDETEAVLWLRVRLRCQKTIDDACRAAAQTYLTRFPGDDRSHLVERITETR